MLTPIREGLFWWSTPDPADDWMMVGHLFVRETGIVFVDPPLIPGLLQAANRLGKPEAVLLSTQNHTRASKYISKRAGVPVYLPEQNPETLDAPEIIKVKEIGKFEVYGAGSVLGFQAYKFGDDYALLSDEKELLVGDNATGDMNGNLVLPPEDLFRKEFKDIVSRTGATTLLASHGYDIYGSLQAQAGKL